MFASLQNDHRMSSSRMLSLKRSSLTHFSKRTLLKGGLRMCTSSNEVGTDRDESRFRPQIALMRSHCKWSSHMVSCQGDLSCMSLNELKSLIVTKQSDTPLNGVTGVSPRNHSGCCSVLHQIHGARCRAEDGRRRRPPAGPALRSCRETCYEPASSQPTGRVFAQSSAQGNVAQ